MTTAKKRTRQSAKPQPLKEIESDASTDSSNDKPRIGLFSEAPSFMRTNKFILSGYRINHRTYSDAIWSLLTVHNESVNVWSHFVGAKLFIALIIYLAFFKQATLWNPLQALADAFGKQTVSSEESDFVDVTVPTCKFISQD